MVVSMEKKVREDGSVESDPESENAEPEESFSELEDASDPLEQAVKSREDNRTQVRVIDKIFFIK